VSYTVRLEAMPRFRESFGGFAAGKLCGKKFLMISAYQSTKPFIQAEQLARKNDDVLFKKASHETIPICSIHYGTSLYITRGPAALTVITALVH